MYKKLFIALAVLSTISAGNSFAQNYTLEVSPSTENITTFPAVNGAQTVKYGSQTIGQDFCTGFNNMMNSQSSRQIIENTAIASASGFSGNTAHHDPYFVEIDGTKYMMIKDNNDGVFDTKDILGIKDTTSTVFNSLRPLDLNGDNKLTGEELTKAGIRLVKVNSQGKLEYKNKNSDFKNENIKFIFMKELRKAYKNDGQKGEFGLFDVIVKDKNGNNKIVTGIVTFESEDAIKKHI